MGALPIEVSRYVEQQLRERIEQLHAQRDAERDERQLLERALDVVGHNHDLQLRRAESAERQRDGWLGEVGPLTAENERLQTALADKLEQINALYAQQAELCRAALVTVGKLEAENDVLRFALIARRLRLAPAPPLPWSPVRRWLARLLLPVVL